MTIIVMEQIKTKYLLLRRIFFTLLLNVVVVLAFVILEQEGVMAGENEHSFNLPGIFKHDNDLHSREILFTVKYPGVINVDVSWEPPERKLEVTLYDQSWQSLVCKKEKSPVHLDYQYSREHYEKAKFVGNTFRVGISQSLFKTVIGSVKISTPDRKVIKENGRDEIRGPFGTFIEEETPEN